MCEPHVVHWTQVICDKVFACEIHLRLQKPNCGPVEVRESMYSNGTGVQTRQYPFESCEADKRLAELQVPRDVLWDHFTRSEQPNSPFPAQRLALDSR
jgi:hypothetical protein